MKLKRFNTGNTKTIRKGKPTIRFTKAGVISLSSELVRNIGLTKKDAIEFIQDEEEPKDWYLLKSNSENGFRLRKYKNEKQLITNSSGMTKTIIETIGKKGVNSVACMVATKATEIEGMKLYAIITSSAS